MNVSVLVGVLGKDPELRNIKGSDNSVCNFSIATRGYKDSTDWHNIECWGKTAENCAKYLKKGSKVSIKGEIKNNNYESNGVNHYGYKINAERVEFLDSKNSESKPQNNEQKGFEEVKDDDIPF